MKKIISFLMAAVLMAAAPAFSEEAAPETRQADFAGGCFWCLEPLFDKIPGVISTTPGYEGGSVVNPTYEQVSKGLTGHAETVRVVYDPSKVSYEKLLDAYWHEIDPTTLNKQFVDEGTQYRTIIFYRDEGQKKLAEESKAALEKSNVYGGKPIVTEIIPAADFYPAEEHHQDYYKKNDIQYHFYRMGSGRDSYLKSVWGKEKKSE
ncbi:MAG TPA: peptide-methionine (S)-S-oxide reductase MsrA [Verrucomicrobiae bacterium]|nr:peptide-methionine (S)-S-oxide reductase MsrA [Verrucomicrobiae bacterium]